MHRRVNWRLRKERSASSSRWVTNFSECRATFYVRPFSQTMGMGLLSISPLPRFEKSHRIKLVDETWIAMDSRWCRHGGWRNSSCAQGRMMNKIQIFAVCLETEIYSGQLIVLNFSSEENGIPEEVSITAKGFTRDFHLLLFLASCQIHVSLTEHPELCSCYRPTSNRLTHLSTAGLLTHLSSLYSKVITSYFCTVDTVLSVTVVSWSAP